MSTFDLFNKVIDRIETNLDLRSRRHGIISSNIANIDTPGYQPFDLMVEKAMQAAEDKRSEPTAPASADTARGPVPGTHIDYSRFLITQDRNTVDVDTEMGKLMRNHLMYSVSAEILARKFQGLKYVISGGK